MSESIATPQGLRTDAGAGRRLQRLAARLETAPLVTLAEIGGAALGGGFELALACDLRIAANEAKVGLPEAGLGLLAAAGGTQRLTRLVGPGIAKRLILGAETLDGAAAERLGLVQWAVPRADLPQAAAGAGRSASPRCRGRRWARPRNVSPPRSITRATVSPKRSHIPASCISKPATRDLVAAFLTPAPR